MREVKVRVGEDGLFEWRAPRAVLTAPDVTVAWAAGDEVITLANSGPVGVSAASITDRAKLTVDSAPDPDFVGLSGAAWLVTDVIGALPVRVVTITDTTVTLAEPLPRNYAPGASDVLIPAVWRGTINAPVAAERDVRWVLPYEYQGSASGTAYRAAETGVIHAVYQPFATGLTSDEVSAKLRSIGSPMAGEQGWEEAIKLGEAELVLHLRDELVNSGLTEDDLVTPQTLIPAHLSLTVASVLDQTAPERASLLRERALELLRLALRRVFVDASKTGATPQEAVQTLTGPRPGEGAGSYTGGSPPPRRQFSTRMSY